MSTQDPNDRTIAIEGLDLIVAHTCARDILCEACAALAPEGDTLDVSDFGALLTRAEVLGALGGLAADSRGRVEVPFVTAATFYALAIAAEASFAARANDGDPGPRFAYEAAHERAARVMGLLRPHLEGG